MNRHPIILILIAALVGAGALSGCHLNVQTDEFCYTQQILQEAIAVDPTKLPGDTASLELFHSVQDLTSAMSDLKSTANSNARVEFKHATIYVREGITNLNFLRRVSVSISTTSDKHPELKPVKIVNYNVDVKEDSTVDSASEYPNKRYNSSSQENLFTHLATAPIDLTLSLTVDSKTMPLKRWIADVKFCFAVEGEYRP